MLKYAVHLFTNVRVKVVGVEAETPAEAMFKASGAVDFHSLLDNANPRSVVQGDMSVTQVEHAEEAVSVALVDTLLENGEVDHDNTHWLDADGASLQNGQTAQERKASGYDRAQLFMQELLAATETLTGIAEEHGARTLADLMYLHAAILADGFIDLYPDETAVLQVVSQLPSAEQWNTYIKLEYLATAP